MGFEVDRAHLSLLRYRSSRLTSTGSAQALDEL